MNSESAHFVSMKEATPWLCAMLQSDQVTSGQLARMRRTKLSDPVSDVWWILARLEVFKLDRRIGQKEADQWVLLVKLLAILIKSNASLMVDEGDSRPSIHNPKIALGIALYECGDNAPKRAGYSELRLASLLDASGVQFVEKLTRMCRMLANKQQVFDCRELAALIQSESQPDAHQWARHKVAQNYYRHAATSEAAQQEEVDQ